MSVVIGAEEKNRKVKSKAEGFSNFQFVTKYLDFCVFVKFTDFKICGVNMEVTLIF